MVIMELDMTETSALHCEMANERLLAVHLQGANDRNWTDEVRREYDMAVQDLLAENCFHLCKNIDGDKVVGPVTERGPYLLYLSIQDNRLKWDIRRVAMNEDGEPEEYKREQVSIPMSPFRSIIKDYFIICESYFSALASSQGPSQIETVDMARRGLHNEGSERLRDMLKPQIDVDMDTARRLFTLICVLHFR